MPTRGLWSEAIRNDIQVGRAQTAVLRIAIVWIYAAGWGHGLWFSLLDSSGLELSYGHRTRLARESLGTRLLDTMSMYSWLIGYRLALRRDVLCAHARVCVTCTNSIGLLDFCRFLHMIQLWLSGVLVPFELSLGCNYASPLPNSS